jgi:hypothetical protein
MSDFLKDLAKFDKKLKKILDEASGPKALDFLGNIAADIIRKRTRKGFGVKKNGGRLEVLDKLSRSYIKFRRRNSSRLSAFTSPGKSNLTFTGEMLNGLISKRSGKSVTITFDSSRNRKVAGYVSVKRPFLFLSIDEIGQLVKTYDKYFAGLVRSRNR